VSLDALAPDQRAVVQLVLQQDRSYEDLAALLGITPEAVRERAQRGLDRLAPSEGVPEADRAVIADYLLGQQSVSARESTRQLLQRAEPARAWALAVASELAGVARSPLPEVPPAEGTAPEPLSPLETESFEPGLDESTVAEPVIADPLAESPSPSRARPRPRREARPVPDYGFDEPADRARDDDEDDATGRTSRIGGALLIVGLGIFIAALIVWLVTRGDDAGDKTSAGTPTETATPAATSSATPNFQPIATLALTSATEGPAKGQLVVYAAQTQEIAFNLKATKVPATAEGEAYGVWLTGGDKPHFLGFTPPVGDDGKLRVSGPRPRDAAEFANWLGTAKQIVVSTETEEGATAPGPLVLEGEIAKAKTVGATATATP
jgi:transposase-like protein